MSHDLPFYGKTILRDREQEHIQKVLEKYKSEPADEALKEKIYDELMDLKGKGEISIPFKVILKKDPSHLFHDQIEIVLDTRV